MPAYRVPPGATLVHDHDGYVLAAPGALPAWPAPPPEPEPEPAETLGQALTRAHDAVEDADAALAEYRARWRAVLTTLAAALAAVFTGAALTWVGVWGPALPLLILGGLVVLCAGAACWFRFADVDGAALRRATRTARRHLRDAYTASLDGGDQP